MRTIRSHLTMNQKVNFVFSEVQYWQKWKYKTFTAGTFWDYRCL